MPTIGYALQPRDGTFFKDGKGWFGNASGRATALDWPFPSTLRGALCTAWGRLQETDQALTPEQWRQTLNGLHLRVAAPLRKPLTTKQWQSEHRLWPVPADALHVIDQDRVEPLVPQPPACPTLGSETADETAREALWRPAPATPVKAKPQPAPRWWGEAEFRAWLLAETVTKTDSFRQPDRRQVHVSLDARTLTAAEGMLYSTSVIEALDDQRMEWAIALQADVPEGGPDLGSAPWTLGGDRRLAEAVALDEALWAMPEGLAQASRGLRLIQITPAQFAAGWLPDGFAADGDRYVGRLPGIAEDVVLRAAAVGRPLHVSGWDMAANGGKGAAKPTQRLVAPGAVYWVVKTSNADFTAAEIRSLWLAAWGERQSDGQGRFVPGLWSHVPAV